MENEHSLTTLEKMIDIGTHKLNIVVTEIPSKFTVVLEAGGGEFSESYQHIQEILASKIQTRIISYDRSGYGKSELGPNKFTAKDECFALKKVLGILGIEDNLILVGLSLGGYLIQYFTQLFPTIVKGLVLIDPMNVIFVDNFGLEKLNSLTPYFDNPSNNAEKAGNRMVDQFEDSLKFLRNKKIPKNIPVHLISAGIPLEPQFWRDSHEQLVSNSERHKIIIAENCQHDIVNDNPELVIETISNLIEEIRKNS